MSCATQAYAGSRWCVGLVVRSARPQPSIQHPLLRGCASGREPGGSRDVRANSPAHANRSDDTARATRADVFSVGLNMSRAAGRAVPQRTRADEIGAVCRRHLRARRQRSRAASGEGDNSLPNRFLAGYVAICDRKSVLVRGKDAIEMRGPNIRNALCGRSRARRTSRCRNQFGVSGVCVDPASSRHVQTWRQGLWTPYHIERSVANSNHADAGRTSALHLVPIDLGRTGGRRGMNIGASVGLIRSAA